MDVYKPTKTLTYMDMEHKMMSIEMVRTRKYLNDMEQHEVDPCMFIIVCVSESFSSSAATSNSSC